MSQEILDAVQANLASIIYFDESDYLRERTSDMNLLLQFIARLESLYVSVDNDEDIKALQCLAIYIELWGPTMVNS